MRGLARETDGGAALAEADGRMHHAFSAVRRRAARPRHEPEEASALEVHDAGLAVQQGAHHISGSRWTSWCYPPLGPYGSSESVEL